MEDETIIRLYEERSEQAISATAEKYGRYCRAIAANILLNDADAEECVNDTYLAAWNAIPPQKPTRFRAFLGRITRNISLDKFDYEHAQKRNRELSQILTELLQCAPADDPVYAYEAGEFARILSDFLYQTKEKDRNIFLRRYWFADSIRAIAERFSCSESKVKSSLFRTRKKLAAVLEQKGIAL